jgi:hypothetical protein
VAVTNQLAALLVAGDPRGAADRTLAFLLSLNKARGGAVFALDGERLTLFTGRGFDVEAVSTVNTAWTTHRAKLQRGEILRGSDAKASYAVAPLVEGGASLGTPGAVGRPGLPVADERRGDRPRASSPAPRAERVEHLSRGPPHGRDAPDHLPAVAAAQHRP